MGRKKILLERAVLEDLYVVQKMSPYTIGRKLGCSFSTITNRLNEWGIDLHSASESRMRYPKTDFNGPVTEAAYMLGFRQGDLNVYVPRAKKSGTIVVRCHTTDMCQVRLMQDLFGKYGQVTVSDRDGHRHVNCFLNNSFSFLIPKDEIPPWVTNDEKAAFSYIAGYVDAEGTFGLNQGRARFKIDSYDFIVLRWIDSFISGKSIRSKFRCVAKKGSKGWGVTPIFNKDLWRIDVNEGRSLMAFIKSLDPYLRHTTRREQVAIALRNIEVRIAYGSI